MIDLPRALPPACCSPPPGPPPTLLLPSDPESPAQARKFAREFIGYHVPDVRETHVDDVMLVTSELVTNSYRYGTEPGDMIQLHLDTEGDRTRVEVHDPVRRTPRHRPESSDRDRGRGLVILDALCPNAWGFDDRPLGKFVWAEVPWNR
ncbi:histidine kinase [Streptomyces phage Picard]|uniref:Histidine kinase n=2 Tax=Picardvirus picard TaxID=2734264 RepID=A0A1J0MC92_9CAUD|nr:transcriptional regulator [Streptomyces phage Picard]APD18556.1 histidine kinase [Streptomyces phage Picard]APD18667.1 histidine kinase [Streptomyces phage Mojorita]